MVDWIDQILDPIITRMVDRVRITRTETMNKILGKNQEVLGHLDRALPELDRTLKSRPDLLRLIMEVYSYLQDEGEGLSQASIEVRRGRDAAQMVAKLHRDGEIEMVSIETYLKAIKVYLQSEVPTIKEAHRLFDTQPREDKPSPYEQSLIELREEEPERFKELQGIWEKVGRE